MIELTKSAEVMANGVRTKYRQVLKTMSEEAAVSKLRKECYYVHPSLLNYAVGAASGSDLETLISLGYARRLGEEWIEVQ